MDVGFYPPPRRVPSSLRTSKLLLAVLGPGHVELDYDALMDSRSHLRQWSGTEWPADDFTLTENLADLERHAREQRDREAFAYTVLNPHGTECVGCVYMIPIAQLAGEHPELAAHPAATAVVDFWVRASRLEERLDEVLFDALLDWLADAWDFDQVWFGVREGCDRQRALVSARCEVGPEVTAGRRGRYELFRHPGVPGLR